MIVVSNHHILAESVTQRQTNETIFLLWQYTSIMSSKIQFLDSIFNFQIQFSIFQGQIQFSVFMPSLSSSLGLSSPRQADSYSPILFLPPALTVQGLSHTWHISSLLFQAVFILLQQFLLQRPTGSSGSRSRAIQTGNFEVLGSQVQKECMILVGLPR